MDTKWKSWPVNVICIIYLWHVYIQYTSLHESHFLRRWNIILSLTFSKLILTLSLALFMCVSAHRTRRHGINLQINFVFTSLLHDVENHVAFDISKFQKKKKIVTSLLHYYVISLSTQWTCSKFFKIEDQKVFTEITFVYCWIHQKWILKFPVTSCPCVGGRCTQTNSFWGHWWILFVHTFIKKRLNIPNLCNIA